MPDEEQNNIIDDENQNPTAGEPTQDDEIQSSSESGVEEGQTQSSSEESSNSSSDALPHYLQSPNMIYGKITCNGLDADSVDKLKAMNIDRRWQCDNRIPTWKWGLVNMGYDFNFVHKQNVVNDTDNMLLKVEADVDTEDGAIRQQIATRDIKYNGQGLQIDTSRETEEEESSSSSN